MSNNGDQSRRVLGVFMLAMINVSLIASLRGVPAIAVYGLGSIFFYALVAITFLVPTSLISAELATAWPETGGVYVWVKEAFGQEWGFFAVWIQWIQNVIWFPTALSFAAASLAYIFDPNLANNKLFMIVVILGVFWGSTFVNSYGMKASGALSSIGAIGGTILPGLLLMGFGVYWLASGHPPQISFAAKNIVPDMGNINNLAFAASIFLLFAGAEASAVHAREVKNPGSDFPKAIFLGALITVAVFTVVTLAIAIVIPEKQINIVQGIMQTVRYFFDALHIGWLVPIMGLLIGLGAIGQVAAWCLGPSKSLLATAIDGNIPPVFAKVNRNGIPVNLLITQGIIITILSMLFLFMPSVNSSFWLLSIFSTQIYLVMYIVMYAAGIYLRYKRPDVQRPYKIPGGNAGMWVVAGIGIVAALAAMIIGFFPPSQLKTGSTAFFVGFLIIGLVVTSLVPFIIFRFRKPDWAVPKGELQDAIE